MSSIAKSFGLQVLFCLYFLAQTGDCQLGAHCWSTVVCGHWTLNCVNFICVCWPPYIPNQDNTLCSVPTDGVCERSGDVCYDPNASCQRGPSDPSVWITTSICTCNTGFGVDPETRICKPLIGSNCKSDGPSCIDRNCVGGKCECDNGLVPSPSLDRCGIPILGSCNIDNPNCASPYAECHPISNTCQCKETYQQAFVNDILDCKIALGAPCESDDECASSFTTCESLRHGNRACTCQEGYVPSEDRTSCLADMCVTDHWPGTCQENRQCSAMFGRYSFCQRNGCTCATGYTYSAEDFGCVLQHAADGISPTFDGIKLLAETLLPFLPPEAKIAVDDLLNEHL